MSSIRERITDKRIKALQERLNFREEAPGYNEHAREVLEEARQNEATYEKMEPALIESRLAGQFAVMCEGQLAAIAPNMQAAVQLAMGKYPGVRPWVRKIGEPIPTVPAGYSR